MTTTAPAHEEPASPQVAPVAVTQPQRRPLPGRLIWALWGGIASVVFLLDQATKVLAVEFLTGRGVVDAGLGGILEWELVRNPNAAFGLPGFSGMFVVVSIVVLALVLRALPKADRMSFGVAYGLLTAGALGNLMDRLFRVPGFPDGAVVDFIKIGWWPKFNIADSAIVTGAILVAVLLFVTERERERDLERRESRQSVRPTATGPRG